MMKKILGLFLVTLLWVGSSFAVSVNGAKVNGDGTWTIALVDEYTIRRDMKADNNDSLRNVDVHHYEKAAAKVEYGLNKYFDVYAKIGTGSMTGKEEMKYSNKWNTNEGILAGGGAKANYEINDKVLVGLDGQLLFLSSHGRYDNRAEKRTFSEWHVAPFVAVTPVEKVSLYGGVKYSGARDRELYVGKRYIYRENRYLGFFGGVDVSLTKHISMNIEGELRDAAGVSSALTYKF